MKPRLLLLGLLGLLGLLACRLPPSDARAYPAAVHAVRVDPASAARVCGGLADAGWEADCYTLGAAGLARRDRVEALAVCARIPDDALADECGFQVAEVAADAAGCAAAGRFGYDCRLHLWRARFAATFSPERHPGEVEEDAAQAITAFGLDADDPQPWAILYAWLFEDDLPLDLRSCADAPSEALAELCRGAGRIVYSERLSRARREGVFPCDGGPLPPALAYLPAPTLDRMLSDRTRGDLCLPDDDPGLAWRHDDEAPVRTPRGTARGRHLAEEGSSRLWPP